MNTDTVKTCLNCAYRIGPTTKDKQYDFENSSCLRNGYPCQNNRTSHHHTGACDINFSQWAQAPIEEASPVERGFWYCFTAGLFSKS